MQPLLNMGFGQEECYRVVSADGASIIQSKSTPMDLPNGSIAFTPDMFAKPVYNNIAGNVSLSNVSDLQYLGMRNVIKPNFGNRMFFGGETAAATLATHNVNAKP